MQIAAWVGFRHKVTLTVTGGKDKREAGNPTLARERWRREVQGDSSGRNSRGLA